MLVSTGGRVVGLELGDPNAEQHKLDAHQVKELLHDLPLRGGAFVEGSHFIFQVRLLCTCQHLLLCKHVSVVRKQKSI